MVQTNEHPLGKYRAIGTVSNMPEFAKAFGCSAGSRDGARGEVPDLVTDPARQRGGGTGPRRR